jgi:hypothetical protein
LALRGNRDACLSFLRHCADYGEKVIGCRLSSTAFPTPFRVMASHDLRERTMRPLSETTNVSVENAASVQGLSLYQSMMVISDVSGQARESSKLHTRRPDL